MDERHSHPHPHHSTSLHQIKRAQEGSNLLHVVVWHDALLFALQIANSQCTLAAFLIDGRGRCP